MFEKDAWVAHEDIVDEIRKLHKSKGKYEPDENSHIRAIEKRKGTGRPGLDGNLMRCRNCEDHIKAEEEYIRAAVRMNVLFPQSDAEKAHPKHRTRVVNVHTNCQSGKTRKCPRCNKHYRNWDQHKKEHSGPIPAVKSSLHKNATYEKPPMLTNEEIINGTYGCGEACRKKLGGDSPPDHIRPENENDHFHDCGAWGLGGAAGMLLQHDGKDGQRRYLLQKRAPWVDLGGTWSVPGGAIGKGEEPHEAARRETEEEWTVGGKPIDWEGIGYKQIGHEQAGPPNHDWKYHTIIGTVKTRFTPDITDESSGSGWFTADEISNLAKDDKLHPAFHSFLKKQGILSDKHTASFIKGAPYGISKEVGGDTPGHTKKMEDCIKEVMKDGKSKKSAIKICKSSLQKYWNKKHAGKIEDMPPCQDPECEPTLIRTPSGLHPVHSDWCVVNPRQKIRAEDTIDPEAWKIWYSTPSISKIQKKIQNMIEEDSEFIILSRKPKDEQVYSDTEQPNIVYPVKEFKNWAIDNVPVTDLPISSVKHELKYLEDTNKPINPDEPILVLTNPDGKLAVADGLHRLGIAHKSGNETIKARVISPDDTDRLKELHGYDNSKKENEHTSSLILAQDGGGGGDGGSGGGDGGGDAGGTSDSGDSGGTTDTGAGDDSSDDGPNGEGKQLVVGPSKDTTHNTKCERCGDRAYSQVTNGFYYWSCPNCGWVKKKKKVEATGIPNTPPTSKNRPPTAPNTPSAVSSPGTAPQIQTNLIGEIMTTDHTQQEIKNPATSAHGAEEGMVRRQIDNLMNKGRGIADVVKKFVGLGFKQIISKEAIGITTDNEEGYHHGDEDPEPIIIPEPVQEPIKEPVVIPEPVVVPEPSKEPVHAKWKRVISHGGDNSLTHDSFPQIHEHTDNGVRLLETKHYGYKWLNMGDERDGVPNQPTSPPFLYSPCYDAGTSIWTPKGLQSKCHCIGRGIQGWVDRESPMPSDYKHEYEIPHNTSVGIEKFLHRDTPEEGHEFEEYYFNQDRYEGSTEHKLATERLKRAGFNTLEDLRGATPQSVHKALRDSTLFSEEASGRGCTGHSVKDCPYIKQLSDGLINRGYSFDGDSLEFKPKIQHTTESHNCGIHVAYSPADLLDRHFPYATDVGVAAKIELGGKVIRGQHSMRAGSGKVVGLFSMTNPEHVINSGLKGPALRSMKMWLEQIHSNTFRNQELLSPGSTPRLEDMDFSPHKATYDDLLNRISEKYNAPILTDWSEQSGIPRVPKKKGKNTP